MTVVQIGQWISGLVILMAGVCQAAEPSYQSVPEFFKIPADWTLGPCSAADMSRKGEIYLFHRGKHPIICFDPAGNVLRSWGDDLIKTAHGLRVDQDDNVWVTDIGDHRVYKFDRNGKLLLALGTGKPGADNDQFNKPTDIAFGPDGEFYVTDGYGNNRVMKFSAKGTLIKSWGSAGKGSGEFNLPHAIVIDSRGRVLVGDRENNRIQAFDRDGNHLETWTGFAPYGMAFRSDGVLFIATGRENDIVELDPAGKIQQRFGRKGKGPGEFDLPHMLTFDADGAMYVAEVGGVRLQKLVRNRVSGN